MSYTTELIDIAKKKLSLSSDYAVAKALGLNPNAVSNYRSGTSHADDRTAIILADATGLDRLRTIARIHADRAKKPEERAFWKRIAAAAAILVAVYASSGTAPANATAQLTYAEQTRHYALSRWLARFLRFVRSLTESKGTGPHVAATVC